MKSIFHTIACIIFGWTVSLFAATPERPVLFVLDASGSMTENLDGIPRIAAAKKLLQQELDQMGPGVPVGLVAYGNRIPGCQSQRLYTPIGAGNRSMVGVQLRRMFPAGRTPLAATLKQIGQTILPKHPNTNIIIISDGAESCGGNPSSAARQLLSQSQNINIHVIGLNVDWETANQLNTVARAGHGKFHDVATRYDFKKAIRSTLTMNGANPYRSESEEESKPLAMAPASSGGDYFEITDVRFALKGAGKHVAQIDYRFRQSSTGDYSVSIQALPNPATSGPGAPLETQERMVAITTEAFYDVSSGEGSMELEIPRPLLRRSVLFAQGELWETTEVPTHLQLSNSERLKL